MLNPKDYPGVFFVCEGIDGAGKTTQIKLLHEALLEKGYDVVRTREPGGTPLAERIRELVLGWDGTEKVHPITELLLMFAARMQHVEEVIVPALKAGKVVLSDRFINSSMVYQVLGHDLPHELFYVLVQHVVAEVNAIPFVTYILDVPDDVSAARLVARSGEQNRLDGGTEEYRKKINDSIRAFAEVPGHYMIDGTGTEDAIHNHILPHAVEVIDNYKLEWEKRSELAASTEPEA